MVNVIQIENIRVLYITHTKKHEKHDGGTFVTLAIGGETFEYPWYENFTRSLQHLCSHVSKHPSVDHIIMVNTEGEVFSDGKFTGYSYPAIFRVEITCNDPDINIEIVKDHVINRE